MRQEARRRFSIAQTAFQRHRRVLYQNRSLSVKRRSELFSTLILSKYVYGCESWTLGDQRTRAAVYSSLLKLYKRLIPGSGHTPISDAEALHRTSLPDPSDLLRMQRLRHLGALYACGTSTAWGLINADVEWTELVACDLDWMWAQLHNSSSLPDPEEHFPAWAYLMQHHRGYWKRLIKRAGLHSAAQHSNRHEVQGFHRRILQQLHQHDGLVSPPPMAAQDLSSGVFACMSCEKRFASRAGCGAHMFKVHGMVHPVRRLFNTTQCGCCLKEYHTYGRLKHHLIRSEFCRRSLHRRGHYELYLGLLDTPDVDRSERYIRQRIGERPISWECCCRTLHRFLEDASDDDLHVLPIGAAACRELVRRLALPHQWTFLLEDFSCADGHWNRDLQLLGQYCCEEAEDSRRLRLHAPIPRGFGRVRYVLHLFSGRRRLGDVQSYFDRFKTDFPDMQIHMISLDVVLSTTWGDLTKPQTRLFWLDAIARRLVVGLLGGPPCETWSQARERHLPDVLHAPRVLRTLAQPWGLDALRLRELSQVRVGNSLMGFELEALIGLYCTGGVGMLEHPAPPQNEDSVSIWRTPLMQIILTLPGFELIQLAQGLWGAKSPKPTSLLMLNAPGFQKELRQWQVAKELPKSLSIGRDSTGQWSTAALKEYPPALNGAIARGLLASINACTLDAEVHIDEEFSRVYQDELALEYLELAKLYQTPHKQIKAHMFHFLYAGLQLHTDLRQAFGEAKGWDQINAAAMAFQERRRQDREQGNPWPDKGCPWGRSAKPTATERPRPLQKEMMSRCPARSRIRRRATKLSPFRSLLSPETCTARARRRVVMGQV
eukprot:s2046_g7.t1